VEKDIEFVKEIASKEKNFPQWYVDVVRKAELADYTTIKFIKERSGTCRRFCSGSCLGYSWWKPEIRRKVGGSPYIRGSYL